ncbi:MAG: hypothetical protein NZM31_10875 [Gemmatales bacterium]|nr:hypothetical protein [Gemmatales bacterium]MDW8387499.1 hypothetical protein [Gemmatales bacterium]
MRQLLALLVAVGLVIGLGCGKQEAKPTKPAGGGKAAETKPTEPPKAGNGQKPGNGPDIKPPDQPKPEEKPAQPKPEDKPGEEKKPADK